MMGNLYETVVDKDKSLQIIRHPYYLSSFPWFDIRVFYVRISSYVVDDYTPECLTLEHIPLSPDTLLEVNGTRCSLYSEGASCLLRRDRADKKSEEVTYVSTDGIKLMGSVKFEVLDTKDLLLSGVLGMSNTNGFIGESNGNARRWSMKCESVMSAGKTFCGKKRTVGSESLSPVIEVFVAGSFLGTPIILTKTLQLSFRKKLNKGMLDSIPEDEMTESQKDAASASPHLQVAEYGNCNPRSEEDYLYWGRTVYSEGDDGELSWFNAGVRVGVGLGLGICLGVGIGVGLLVRTYQATSRTFRRRLV